MAKRKKSSKSSKCPEPFNTLIDIAAAATIGYLADKRRKKRKGAKNKIDPYAATGVAMGLGKINNTEDLIAFGGMLGALGAFDDESDYHANDNRFAWRLNCVDGSEYGIDPEDYETRDEYNDALAERMAESSYEGKDDLSFSEDNTSISISFDTTSELFTVCRISRLDNGANTNYYAGEYSVKVGDRVMVPNGNGTAEGIVIAVFEQRSSELEELETILGVLGK